MSKDFELRESKSKYILDKSGSYISNIPYEKYIFNESIPQGAVYAFLSENNSAEENSRIIQMGIDNLSDNGGGFLAINKGRYRIRPIELKSNVSLWVSYGTELIACGYDETQEYLTDKKAVIYANNAENICLLGGGVINGNGEEFVLPAAETTQLKPLEKFNTYERVIKARKRIRFSKGGHRLQLINFSECKNIKIDNVILRNSACWTCCLEYCEKVVIENIIIDNNVHTANADGIDIVSSADVKVTNSFIATADDGICIKTFAKPTTNVKITGCEVISFANCFKIGTETQSDISKVNLSYCNFYMPLNVTGGYAGIAIESADGAHVEDVHILCVSMFGVSAAFLIWLGCRLKGELKTPGSIKNVSLEEVYSHDVELPSAITGCTFKGKTYYVENPSLTDVCIFYRDTAEALNIKEDVDEISMSDYPEITRVSHVYRNSHEESDYWDLPCYGVFHRHVKNLFYWGYTIKARKCNKRKEFLTIDKIQN